LKVERAHISGLSLGAAVGMWLAAKYPQQVKSLSLHGGWTKTDLFIKTVVEGWQVMVRGSGSVTETLIQSVFPWCFIPSPFE
jgi:pimeloyl-ACP methyl ester carboxylesterase